MTNSSFTRAQAWAMFAAGTITNTKLSSTAATAIADQMLAEFDKRFPEYTEVEEAPPPYYRPFEE